MEVHCSSEKFGTTPPKLVLVTDGSRGVPLDARKLPLYPAIGKNYTLKRLGSNTPVSPDLT